MESVSSFFKDVIEISPLGISIIDINKEIIYSNSLASSLLKA